MSRRRMMMMMQQRKGFEIVYNSPSGVFPENIDGWSWRKGNANGKIGVGGVALTDSLLVVKANHLYENVIYYPTEHLTARNCEASVTVTDWYRSVAGGSAYKTGIVRIGLTDGVSYAICAIDEEYLYIGAIANDNSLNKGNSLAKIPITTPNEFTLRVRFMGGKAEYYINDELIYTQTEPYSVDKLSYGGITSYFVSTPQNFIGFGTACITTISDMTYKEW